MPETLWFSAMLRFAVLVQGEGLSSIARSVVILSATDWASAKDSAVQTGTAMEQTYTNGDGAEIRWRLVAVETLDQLSGNIDHGLEVYSEIVEPSGLEYDFDTVFRPEESEPTQSGV